MSCFATRVEWGLRTHLGFSDGLCSELPEGHKTFSSSHLRYLNRVKMKLPFLTIASFCFSYNAFLIEILFLLVGVSLLLISPCHTLPIESIYKEKILAYDFLKVWNSAYNLYQEQNRGRSLPAVSHATFQGCLGCKLMRQYTCNRSIAAHTGHS